MSTFLDGRTDSRTAEVTILDQFVIQKKKGTTRDTAAVEVAVVIAK